MSAEAVHVDDAMSIYSEMCTLSAALPPAQSLVDHRTYELLIRMCVCEGPGQGVGTQGGDEREGAAPHERVLRAHREGLHAQRHDCRGAQDPRGGAGNGRQGTFARCCRPGLVNNLSLSLSLSLSLQIHERNLTVLRNRCTKLSVSHVALGDDPQAWVKDVKRVRRNRKESSRRVIQTLQSAAWHWTRYD